MTVHGYVLQINSVCRGADREVKKPTFAACEAHCASRKCACSHFVDGVCHFGFTFLGLLKSKEGAQASVRPNAENEPAALKAAAREAADAAASEAQRAAAACGAPPPRRMAPTFFMYSGPEFDWAERLTRCYTAKNGRSPWAMPVTTRFNASYSEIGPAPSADLSHALWLHHSLLSHRKRQTEGSNAALYVVPAFGSLSEATGTCEGTTHAQRLSAAAAAVRASPWFKEAPKRHVVYAAAVSEDQAPLGELGTVLARGGAMAWCTSRTRCSAKFTKRAEVPMLPLLSLLHPRVFPKLAGEACPRPPALPKRRPITIFFRGAHGTSAAAQAVRAKLWELRSLSVWPSASAGGESGQDGGSRLKAEIKFSRGGPGGLSRDTKDANPNPDPGPDPEPDPNPGELSRDTKDALRQAGWNSKDVRLPYNVDAYSEGMLHSDFCVLPRGETSSPGRRLVDAVAAGCIPLIIGDNIKPPHEKLIQYDAFTVRVAESEFVRYPKGVITTAIAEAVPKLATLRRNLLAARDDLLLGTGTAPTVANATVARGADFLLLEAGRTFCPRTPASFKACLDTGFV